jgi:restriction endonuclease Mrr
MIITTSGYTESAQDFAAQHRGITLIDGQELIQMMQRV